MNNGMMGFPIGASNSPPERKRWVKSYTGKRTLGTWYYNPSDQDMVILLGHVTGGGCFVADIRSDLSKQSSGWGGEYQWGGYGYTGGGNYYGGEWLLIPPKCWYYIFSYQSLGFTGSWIEYSDVPGP